MSDILLLPNEGTIIKKGEKALLLLFILKFIDCITCDDLGGSNIQFVANVPSFLASKLKLVSGLEGKP